MKEEKREQVEFSEIKVKKFHLLRIVIEMGLSGLGRS